MILNTILIFCKKQNFWAENKKKEEKFRIFPPFNFEFQSLVSQGREIMAGTTEPEKFRISSVWAAVYPMVQRHYF